MFCLKCGQFIEEGKAFCKNCGSSAPKPQEGRAEQPPPRLQRTSRRLQRRRLQRRGQSSYRRRPLRPPRRSSLRHRHRHLPDTPAATPASPSRARRGRSAELGSLWASWSRRSLSWPGPAWESISATSGTATTRSRPPRLWWLSRPPPAQTPGFLRMALPTPRRTMVSRLTKMPPSSR